MRILAETAPERSFTEMFEDLEKRAGEQDWGRFNETALECFKKAVINTFTNFETRGQLFTPPFATEAYLYFGHSHYLQGSKIGVSRSPESRARQINSSMRHLGLPKDFEMIDYFRVPERIAYALESSSKIILADINKHGEWYQTDEGRLFEWHFYAYEDGHKLWRSYLEDLTFADCLRASKGIVPLFNKKPSYVGEALLREAHKWAQMDIAAMKARLVVPA